MWAGFPSMSVRTVDMAMRQLVSRRRAQIDNSHREGQLLPGQWMIEIQHDLIAFDLDNTRKADIAIIVFDLNFLVDGKLAVFRDFASIDRGLSLWIVFAVSVLGLQDDFLVVPGSHAVKGLLQAGDDVSVSLYELDRLVADGCIQHLTCDTQRVLQAYDEVVLDCSFVYHTSPSGTLHQCRGPRRP